MREVALWWANSRGCWDQGLLLAMLNGDLWPTAGVRWREFQGEPPPRDQGAVVVVSGIMLDRKPEECAVIKEIVAAMPWCVLIHTGDESWEFDTHVFEKPRLKLWMVHPMPGTPQWGHRQRLLGWPWPSRQTLRETSLKPLSERRLDWCFAGHTFEHPSRARLVQLLSTLSGGEVHVSGGFAQGLPQPDFLRLLAETRIVPCPAGHKTYESLRMFECIEAGCLPVSEREPLCWRQETPPDFWGPILGGPPPWPLVDTWEQLPDLLAKYKADPVGLQQAANKVGAWWQLYKRQYVLDLLDDIVEVSGEPI